MAAFIATEHDTYWVQVVMRGPSMILGFGVNVILLLVVIVYLAGNPLHSRGYLFSYHTNHKIYKVGKNPIITLLFSLSSYPILPIVANPLLRDLSECIRRNSVS